MARKKDQQTALSLQQLDEENRRACQAIEQGELDEGLTLFQQILEQLHDGQRLLKARLLSNIGVVAARLRRLPLSRQAFEHALKLFREEEDPKQVALQLGNLGSVCRDSGDYPQAIEYYESAVELLGPHFGEELLADQLSNLAFAYAQLDPPRRAVEHFERAREIYDRCNNSEKSQLAMDNIKRLQSHS